MKLKTFLSTFILFLVILFSSLGVVSVYMTQKQMNMLRDKSAAEYQMMATSFSQNIAALPASEDHKALDRMVRAYKEHYEKYNISVALSDLESSGQKSDAPEATEMSVLTRNDEHFIYITGLLTEPLQNYQLDYYYNITDNVTELHSIRNTLMSVGIIFSAITACSLHLILSGIFTPLDIVARTSRKIAAGHYSERIPVNGKHEVAAMAEDFNQMAGELENQICLLEHEAVQKQQFVDNFAHEIRTPLTSIYGYAEYMQKAALSEEELIESTQFIIDEASHMKKLSNSLLELATLRHYKLIEKKILLPRLFEDIKQTMRTTFVERNIEFHYLCEIETLKGQEDLIRSLLLNLCGNAADACPSEQGRIQLKSSRNGDSTILSVTDNGCGIPEEHISKITDPFYRVDKVRSRKNGGAGIGLAICHQIAAVHGALMNIRSVPDSGTTIEITFTTS